MWAGHHEQLLEHSRQRGHRVKRPIDESSLAVLSSKEKDVLIMIKALWYELQPERLLRLDHVGTHG